MKNIFPGWMSQLQNPANGIGDGNDLQVNAIRYPNNIWGLAVNPGYYYLDGKERYLYGLEGNYIYGILPSGNNELVVNDSFNPGFGPLLVDTVSHNLLMIADVSPLMATSLNSSSASAGDPNNELNSLKAVMSALVTNIQTVNPEAKMGLISYSTTQTINQALTNNFTAVQSAVTSLTVASSGGGCMKEALTFASQQALIQTDPHETLDYILFTDGNWTTGNPSSTVTSILSQLSQANKRLFVVQIVTPYTVSTNPGPPPGINASTLTAMATGYIHYFHGF